MHTRVDDAERYSSQHYTVCTLLRLDPGAARVSSRSTLRSVPTVVCALDA